jgi:hypothetical protein
MIGICTALPRGLWQKCAKTIQQVTGLEGGLNGYERAAADKRHDEEEEQLAVATRELEEALVNLMPGERQELEDEFTAAIESGALPGGTFFQEQFRLSGFDSIIVQSMFRNFARERLLATEK